MLNRVHICEDTDYRMSGTGESRIFFVAEVSGLRNMQMFSAEAGDLRNMQMFSAEAGDLRNM